MLLYRSADEIVKVSHGHAKFIGSSLFVHFLFSTIRKIEPLRIDIRSQSFLTTKHHRMSITRCEAFGNQLQRGF